MNDLAVCTLLAIVLVVAVYADLRTSRVPNWLTFSAVGCALVAHSWLGGVEEAVFCLSGMGTGLSLFLILYVFGDVGAGDVKLMAAIGAIVGPYGALLSGILAIMVGGLYALAAMCYQWGLRHAVQKLTLNIRRALLIEGNVSTSETQLPLRLRYGLAVAGGTLLFQIGFRPFGG